MPSNSDSDDATTSAASTGQKQGPSTALQLGPRKKPSMRSLAIDPLVHHGCHFGRAVHSFCNVQTLITNSLLVMADQEVEPSNLPTEVERREYTVFHELLRMIPGLEAKLMTASDEEVIHLADLIQKGGQSLSPHIPCNVKAGHGFNHERTDALLCPAGLDWANTETKTKLINGQIQVAGDQWPVFLYANYTYDPEDPWNGLLWSGLLVSVYKHIFTSPSSVDQEPKATWSGNACIHGMRSVTKASLACVSTQACFALTSAQVFSHTDHVTDSERFYSSILELLYDLDEKDEVEQVLTWWNCQIFPLYSDIERLPSKNSAFARICQKRAEYKERVVAIIADA
ncbi:hypothetical protein BDN67DRAFT_992145 [Paxillus ammoniavirescens]|nr:hypothetical protein BDN67DRAFT_992145 [Paxillus ammoniavirescens]